MMKTPITEPRPAHALPATAYQPNSTLQTIWHIARRQMIEAMRGRTTVTMLIFLAGLAHGDGLFTLRPLVDIPHPGSFAGTMIAFYLSYVGLLICRVR